MHQRRPRLVNIQVMRGIAAMAVVFAHAVDLAVDNVDHFGRSYIGSYLFLENFGAIGVDLFFIISGFVMALSIKNLSGIRDAIAFMVYRVARIAPLYFLGTAAMACYLFFAGQSVSIWSLINAIVFIPFCDTTNYSFPPLSVGWTLSFEFTFYAFLSGFIILRCAGRATLLAMIFFAFVWLGTLLQPKTFLLNWITNPIILEFALGVLAYRAWSQCFFNRSKFFWLILSFTSMLALGLQVVYGYGSISEAEGTTSGKLSAVRVLFWGVPCLLIFIVAISIEVKKSNSIWLKLAHAVGDASYSIYLSHLLVFIALQKVLIRMPPMHADIVVLLAVILAAMIGWAVYIKVEKALVRQTRACADRLIKGRNMHVAFSPGEP